MSFIYKSISLLLVLTLPTSTFANPYPRGETDPLLEAQNNLNNSLSNGFLEAARERAHLELYAVRENAKAVTHTSFSVENFKSGAVLVFKNRNFNLGKEAAHFAIQVNLEKEGLISFSPKAWVNDRAEPIPDVNSFSSIDLEKDGFDLTNQVESKINELKDSFDSNYGEVGSKSDCQEKVLKVMGLLVVAAVISVGVFVALALSKSQASRAYARVYYPILAFISLAVFVTDWNGLCE